MLNQKINKIKALFIHGSCHLGRPSNVEIGVEYQRIFVVAFLIVAAFFIDIVKCILGHLQDLEKGGWFHYKNCRVIHPSYQSSKTQKSK